MVLAGCLSDNKLGDATPESVTVEATPTTTGPDFRPSPMAVESLAPREIEFESNDGTTISGTYYPPVSMPASGVVLMHMMGGSRVDWNEFAGLLQGAGLSQTAGSRPPIAILAIDMRGHGISGGSRDDQAGMINDATAALQYLQTQPEVDPSSIFLIGASIGADAAVDACGDGCVGAISLSPGGFLGQQYSDALKSLIDKPVLCVASLGDVQSANSCNDGETVGLGDYQVQIYAGDNHGTQMFSIIDEQPLLTDLLFDWLRRHLN
jgi:dienelactone hydrolase